MKKVLLIFLIIALLCLSSCGKENSIAITSEEETATAIQAIDISEANQRKLSMYDMGYYSELDIYVCKKIVEMAKSVAEGKLQDTVLNIDVKDMMGKLVFSPEEAGVRKFTKDNLSDAVWRILDFNVGIFDNSMLEENPFIFFWYDYAKGFVQTPFSVETLDNGNVVLPDTITFNFIVSSEYQYQGNPYKVDPEQVKYANSSKDYALSIVEEAKNLTDIEKLKYYCDKICELNDYNYDAAGRIATEDAYGNPWQMVYVFDQNPDTKALCEGYTRAFQFLCDETDFEEDIFVYTARGEKLGGAHVWNIVHMNDGNNYMIDVTTCDNRSSNGVRVCFMMAPDEGNWEDGYVFHGKELTTATGVVQIPEMVYTYDDLTKSLWENTILDISMEDYPLK